MKNNIHRTVFIIWILAALLYPASSRGNDSSRVLSLHTVLQLVRSCHPLMAQAENSQLEGWATLLMSRGNFDPKIEYQSQKKYFDQKEYYNLEKLGIVIPAYPGIQFTAGYESNSGQYLNPDETTPAPGLSSAGIQIPLLKNLITDKRRTVLKQAQLFRDQTEIGKQIIMNDLAFQVLSDYTDWYMAWRELEIYQQSYNITETRLSAIRREVAAGSKAPVDTLETWTQLIQFGVLVQEYRMRFIKAGLMMGVHLWNHDYQPLETGPGIIPDSAGFDLLDSLCLQFPDTLYSDRISELNPWVRISNLDVQSYELETRLKRQNMLPQLDLKYHLLSPGVFDYPDRIDLNQNYAFGLRFSSSLFLRQERGEYRLAGIREDNARLKFIQKNREVAQKTAALWQQRTISYNIYKDYASVTRGFELLYRTELVRMSSGESNMFMVNTREMKFTEARLKQVNAYKKYLESGTAYLNNCGLLWLLLD